MPAPDITAQIYAWLQGDDAAFEAVYYHYKGRLLRYTRKFLKSESHAEDITTEVLVKLWQSRSAITNATTFENYLFTIARNRLIKEWQKTIDTMLSLESAGELPDMAGAGDLVILTKELEHCYRESLKNLPEQRRRIFLLHRDGNLNYNQIAAQLHISPKTVENQIAAALKYLRTRLAQYLLSVMI